MRSYLHLALFAMIIVGAFYVLSAAAACTKQQQTDLQTAIAGLAGEVCIEGDDIKGCLSKCQAAASAAPSITSAAPSAAPSAASDALHAEPNAPTVGTSGAEGQ